MALRNLEEDSHFKRFAVTLEKSIAQLGSSDQGALVRQREMIERMVSLEKDFRLALLSHRWGLSVYNKFIYHIRKERQNVLAARPFFRERQEVFTSRISEAIKTSNAKALSKFGFNFQFIAFALKAKKWKPRSQVNLVAQEHAKVRDEIVRLNMPLAISRSRIFYSRTPQSHLQYMDLVQISCEGLMAAVDKFCLPFRPIFPCVVIGRITGNFIEQYSETSVHFYPKDKRRLYRANKILGKQTGAVDFELLSEQVNDAVDPGHKTNPSELAGLMAAASTVSADTPGLHEDGDAQALISRCAAPESCRPDVSYEGAEVSAVLTNAAVGLNPLERKLLKLKGLNFAIE